MGEDPFELVGSTLHQKYAVQAVVGEGGFGVVYRGQHRRLEQTVAIKCLRIPQRFTAEAKATLVERFRAEGGHLARLSKHPAIPSVFDFAVAAGPADEAVPYLVLEWLDGEDLDAYLAHHGRVGERDALALVRDVADALAFAHGQVGGDEETAHAAASTTAPGTGPPVRRPPPPGHRSRSPCRRERHERPRFRLRVPRPNRRHHAVAVGHSPWRSRS